MVRSFFSNRKGGFDYDVKFDHVGILEGPFNESEISDAENAKPAAIKRKRNGKALQSIDTNAAR